MEKKWYIDLIDEDVLIVEDIVGGIIGGKVTFAELQQTGRFIPQKQENVKAFFKNKIEDLSAEDIFNGITGGIATFAELQQTGEFGHEKQSSVRAFLRQKDDEDAFAAANTITELQQYLLSFPAPDGKYVTEAKKKIQQIKEEEANKAIQKEKEEMLRKIKADINEYTPDEIIKKLSSKDLDDLCAELGLDAQMVRDYTEPPLNPNFIIPQNANEIPAGYTDVFFWGIPSSGKTCALSAIFSTMKKEYVMEEPDSKKKFGATYRHSLTNIFSNEYGYLPGRTTEDRTHYMPFLFYKRDDNRKRRIAFFELSGEVFKFFYDDINSTQIISSNERNEIEKSFKALELLLNSKNQKIHFFFIDYNQETRHTKDNNGLTQSNYLEAAATYFRDKNDILKKKTDAVFVVITKSDEISIKRIISDKERIKEREDIARLFLADNFGTFMGVLQNLCKNNHVDLKVKLFSIGDVYFKRVCKINRFYAKNIIEELLYRANIEGGRFRGILNN